MGLAIDLCSSHISYEHVFCIASEFVIFWLLGTMLIFFTPLVVSVEARVGIQGGLDIGSCFKIPDYP